MLGMHARSICVQCVDIAIGELLFWNAIRLLRLESRVTSFVLTTLHPRITLIIDT